MNKLFTQINDQNRWKYRSGASVAALLLVGLLTLWWYGARHVSTEDAYLNADIVRIAPRVSGQVTHLYVENNQFVTKGQPLFELDLTPFQIAVNKASAQLAIDQANQQNAAASAERTLILVRKKVLSAQAGDDATAKLKSATAAVQLANANLEQARLNFNYAHVSAPTSGWVTNMSLREGNIVESDQQLFAVISNEEFWVDANFKETELGEIRPQQKAHVRIDMYPGQVFSGVVESISGGSGTVFSLMPPQNATGNWVKVTQRVPVRIRILSVNAKQPLRIGTSAKVTVDLKS